MLEFKTIIIIKNSTTASSIGSKLKSTKELIKEASQCCFFKNQASIIGDKKCII